MTEISEQARLRQILEFCLDKDLERILLSNPADADAFSKSKLRPLLLKGEVIFQAEEQRGKQAFHKNLTKEEAILYVENCLSRDFRQAEITSANGQGHCPCKQKRKDDGKV